MLWIAFATQLAAAQPINHPSWFRLDDLPISEFADDEVRTVAYRLTVRPDGTIQNCQVEVTSGVKKFDQLTCRLAQRRARFNPASSSDGRPSYGVFRSSIMWAVNPPGSYARPVDAELKVNTLPKGERSPVAIGVIFAVDKEGNPSSCSAERAKAHPVLVRIACGEITRSYKAIPATEDSGAPVPSVQNALVTIVAD
jgi:TonB family protein